MCSSDLAVYGGMPTLDTDSTALAAAAGGSVIDVITAAAGTTFSTAEGSTWTGGGTGATPDGEWDSEVSDWDTGLPADGLGGIAMGEDFVVRSEEHTSELQSRTNLVCRLLLEKKKNKNH